ncbi:hypothetical protein REPUB_Repub16aG0068100 [Reevesia pubescens]
METLVATLKIISKLAKEVVIQIIEENLFLFKYQTRADKNRVLEGAPWSFDKHLIVLQEYDMNLRPNGYTFTKSSFWIRIYDLLLGMRNQAMAEKIGWKIGTLQATDTAMETGG